MIKKYFLFLLLLSFCRIGTAQNIPFQIQKSDVFKDEISKSAIVLAEKRENNDLLIVRSYNNNGIAQNEGFYIEQYNSDLKLIKEFDFQLKHINSRKFDMVIGLFSMGNNIVIVDVYYDLSRKSYVCEANSINYDFKIDTKELFSLSREEAKMLGAFSLEEKMYQRTSVVWTNDNSGNINSEFDDDGSLKKSKSDIVLAVNENKSGFAIAMDFNDEKKDDLKLYFFDNNLNKKYETVFKKEIKDDKYIFQNILVSNDGNAIFIVAKSCLDELKQKKIGGKYVFELTKVTASSQQSTQIDPKEHYIDNVKVTSLDNKLVVTGFYSDVEDSTRQFRLTGLVHPFNYIGLCYFKLDANNMNVTDTKYNVFTNQFLIDKFGDNKKYEFSHLKFRNIHFGNQDDLFITAEEETIWHSNGGVGIGVGTKEITSYEFGDIVCLKLDAAGNLIWARNINKDQSYADDDSFYLSYCSLFQNNNSYLFLNTGEKVKKLNNDIIEFKHVNKNKSNLNIIMVNSNGEFDYQEILDDEQNEMPFMVSKGIVIDNTTYFLGRKGSKKQLLKVTL